MKNFPGVVFALMVLALLPSPVNSKEKRVWQGYLIDRMCMKAVADSADPLDFVYHHTKDCVLMPACKKKGFTLYMAKKKQWFNLDKKGNELAEKVISKSKRNSAFFVSVKGRVVKGVLEVDGITETDLKRGKAN